MSVRLLAGRSGSGKTAFCIDSIREKLFADPEGNPIIYLVPDQMTFMSDQNLAGSEGLGGMFRAQVYSFTRLAWRVLQETGGISRQHINSVGISMLIRSIIEEKKEELSLFKKVADKNGFIGQVEQLVTEFRRYCVTPEELGGRQQGIAEAGNTDRALLDKLHDLEIIYQSFEENMLGKYIDGEDYFRLLAEKVSSSEYLKKAEVFIDGFYSFTPQEYLILQQLIQTCKNVTITFTVDEPERNSFANELDLFRMSKETYATIYSFARQLGVEVEEEIFGEIHRDMHESLKHIEAHFDSRPAVPYSGDSAVRFAESVNPRAEIEGVAREIKKLIRQQGYRYRDISLLSRNTGEYQNIIETIFADYEIPFFIDQKRTMHFHPLVELIRSTLEIIETNWRYEPVFRAVKTELLFPLHMRKSNIREKVDKLENYCLAYGIKGDKWTRKERWKYRRFQGLEWDQGVQTDSEKQMEQELNELRLSLAAPIMRLANRLKRAKTGRAKCEALYLYLEELEVPEKMDLWKVELEEKGELVKAGEHDQAWNSIVDLLDQFVEILGEEEMARKQFATILDAGLDTLKFSLVPPAIDQVLIADLENSRLGRIKAAFVIGLNEGVFPAKFTDDGIFADSDRESLVEAGMKLAPTSKTRLLDEEFLAYKAFTAASERLYLTYPLANDEGKSLLPSLYVKRMRDLVPEAKTLYFMADPKELSELGQLGYAVDLKTSLSYLNGQLQLKKRHYPIYDFWWDVYNAYIDNDQWRAAAKKVFSSLTYQNRTSSLADETSTMLYGESITASVSRMELFQSCPFSHFATHGLKLKERQVYRLEAPAIGDLFHAALKYIAETVLHENMMWSDLTREQCEMLAKDAVEMLAPKLQNEILLSTNRHHYIKRKLEQIISRASFILSEHAKYSGFAPIDLELEFGPKGKLPPMGFSLRNGTKMELVGRIDRVDKAELNNEVYLRVIDYKSSAHELNMNEVYYGLSLQMLTYLDLIISNSSILVEKEANPAGVLYFHVHNPVLSTKKVLTLDEIEEELFKKFKMNGLMLGKEDVIKLMDGSLEKGDSPIVPAGVKTDGTLTKRSKVASREDFSSLQKFVRHKYVETGNKIIGGNVEIAPYQLKEKSPCTFCSFKSVCQFDEGLESNQYRKLQTFSKEEALELIRKEANANENN
ncbi:helicase-exonuclease AddAB subunit AddB [Niallia taxi]|uniref:helicase-exonuclease AddAB subunit AddB n=1 Tax=Niallia taxi TaxID=2499688 RepID=UPI002934C406|nr:helicase-exonuclease AddAB subunit AddB [Niallia taxi]MED3962360.1 helicase-exonuclease AddAB subunit AddB [Niallia taxi]WOD62599.1 helicase-exonuclease AddAB subunit AddB [Niallia taxi]